MPDNILSDMVETIILEHTLEDKSFRKYKFEPGAVTISGIYVQV